MNIPPLILAAALPGTSLTGLDWLVIALYFGILLCVAWWVVRNNKDTAADYFLAGRNLGWWVIGASIFASNIGSEHIVGLAGSGAKDGVAMAHYELHAWCLLVLAWVFVPFYARSLVFTMPEFLERRFCTKSRYMLSIVSIVTFIVSKIAVGIFAGGVVFGTLLPELKITVGSLVIDSFWIGSILVIVLTGLYTTLGGMRAVVYNDAVQVVVLIGGSALLTVYGLIKLGGWGELRRVCGSDMFNLWKPMVPPGVISTWSPVWKRPLPVKPSGRPGISTRTSRGSAWPSARRSSASGIGAPTNTSSSARSAPRTKRSRDRAVSSPPSSSCSRCICSSSPA